MLRTLLFHATLTLLILTSDRKVYAQTNLYFSAGSPEGSHVLGDGNRWNGLPSSGVFGSFENNDGSIASGVTVSIASDNGSFDNGGSFDNIFSVPSDTNAGNGVSTNPSSDVGRSIFWNSNSDSAIAVTISGLNPESAHEVGIVVAAGGRPNDHRTYDVFLNAVQILDEYDEIDGAAGATPFFSTVSTSTGEISFEILTGDSGPHALLNAFVVNAIPEPSSLALAIPGLLACLVRRFRHVVGVC